MNEKKDDGGQAFPNPALADENYIGQPGDNGMTLRDWFAGQALAQVYAETYAMRGTFDKFSVAAAASYEIADAMLAERAKQ